MTPIEMYEFDRNGFLVIPGLLTGSECDGLLAASLLLEQHALLHVDEAPRKRSGWGTEGHRSPSWGYHAHGGRSAGSTLIVEDFWNADPAYDSLLGHPKTLRYIEAVVEGRPTINNSELRIRYPGNATGSHMGGPLSHKYRYAFTHGRIDCMMVRMVYFLHDVTVAEGAFAVVPGTHKSNYASPYGTNGDDEPGLVGLEVRAGDAILFTENLRHGGLTNLSERTRRTLHVGYGPHWMMSQNILTMDEPHYLTPTTRQRLTPEQLSLFQVWPPASHE